MVSCNVPCELGTSCPEEAVAKDVAPRAYAFAPSGPQPRVTATRTLGKCCVGERWPSWSDNRPGSFAAVHDLCRVNQWSPATAPSAAR